MSADGVLTWKDTPGQRFVDDDDRLRVRIDQFDDEAVENVFLGDEDLRVVERLHYRDQQFASRQYDVGASRLEQSETLRGVVHHGPGNHRLHPQFGFGLGTAYLGQDVERHGQQEARREHADVVFPGEAYPEKEGTVTNLEGRVQKVNEIIPAPGQSRPDWAILDDLSSIMGHPMGLSSAGQISKEIAEVAPAYQGISWDLLEWDARDGAVKSGEVMNSAIASMMKMR